VLTKSNEGVKEDVMAEKSKSVENVVFMMIPNRKQDTGMDPISGNRLKTLEAFTCTYEQAFGHGIAAEVMKGIEIPNGLDFYFRPYNDARVLGLLRKPYNTNTFKYFLGKAENCKTNDELFVNEIIDYFIKENQKNKSDIFNVKRGKTNWGTVNVSDHNKDIAIKVINEALVEVAKQYGLDGKPTTTIRPNVKPIENQYLPTKADCEMALAALKKSKKDSSVTKEDLFDWLVQHLQDKGISMKSNWKVITERNLEFWFS
jgi:hypothetical protein